ncbi:rod shape-determining protein RodA [Embleya scabrispora]|uniref:rod shape-determining protein RodA n=1 Tax=Embleya scabrispora TaxID=159449 RepID=UPI00036212F8|nr:rod shape-determining protein RodA [Embleya scabrispora]MYS82504.1 rod shape-determining protein RodA [Streptomyces sp. SID5474]
MFTPRRSITRQIIQRDAPVRRLDWMLLGPALALSAVGSLLVWSATRNRRGITGGDPQFFFKRHLLNLAIGLVLATGVAIIGHRRIRAFAPFVAIAAVLGLMAALSPLGSTINGQRAWIQLGAGFSVQPAELAKIAIILCMGMILAERVDTGDLTRPGDKAVFWALVVAAVPMVVIMLMPDLGSVMVLAMIVLGVLLASGARARWMIALMVMAAAGAVAVVQLGLLSEYQIDRFRAFADPDFDPGGVGYNTAMARLAIGSGGLMGKGLFNGEQTSGQYVPEQQTDFVFSVAGEELGFIGCCVIIALFGILLWRGIRIALHADDLYGTVVAAGVVAWFAFQAFENIGMNLGIMPVAGLPLPFVSYGGSSMFAIWMGIGLLQSVHMRHAGAFKTA